MKKHILKSIFAALLVASMAFGMTACGAPAADANGASTAAPAAMTEDEYKAKFEEIGTTFSDLQTKLGTIDPTDADAAAKLLEDCKKPFAELAAVTPPEKYAEAHVKFKSGSEAMVSYIDTTLLVLKETDATKQQELAKTLQESMTTAIADLTEGSQLAEQADK